MIPCQKQLPMILAFGWMSVASADEDCLASAQTDLERIYCEVVARGGAGLPSMMDFRRNDSRVQALLLRQPARSLGLTLPEVSSIPEPEVARQTEEPAKESGSELAITRVLAGCQLQEELIQCPGLAYELAANRSLETLDDGVLEPGNRLGIVPFDGERNDDEAVRTYLSAAYDRYIPQMLAIGLGANTMSFTAFHNAFHTLESGGVDFSERMEKTYELLKQDRKTLGLKTRYHNELPESLSLCETINRDVIVCDNVRTNWVFVRAD
ncbi:hypothetical protein ACTXK7_15660 [Vreelandella alkaliphila]|uniref:hypothetical protein n=2 Tax=Gammaproteobacteria TaxID=1236 RepID=UPI001D02131F|nr:MULTISPECIES: hypothetical protein [Halomonas]